MMYHNDDLDYKELWKSERQWRLADRNEALQLRKRLDRVENAVRIVRNDIERALNNEMPAAAVPFLRQIYDHLSSVISTELD